MRDSVHPLFWYKFTTSIYVPGPNLQRPSSFLVHISSGRGQYHAVEIGARPAGDVRRDRRKGGTDALQDSVNPQEYLADKKHPPPRTLP